MGDFGDNLKFLRKRAKLTQEEIANRLNISHQSISKWENNISLPTIEYCIPLTEILNCSLNELFNVKK